MKLLTKYTMAILLSIVLICTTPVPSHAFAGAILDTIGTVKKGIERAIKVIKWTQSSVEILSYPNEYIREVNSIFDEIETLKRMAATARLSVGDMNKFLQLAKQYGSSLDSSLNEFEGIVEIVSETTSMLLTDAGDSMNMTEVIQRIKTQHKANMKALAGARRIVNNSKALIAGSHAANKVIGSSKKLK